jgi:Kef-type K+ transport system membrane component KefB
VGFATLALIGAVALAGPLLALPRRWHLPVVLGELVVGVALGRSGTHTLHPGDATFSFLADVGFALVMVVAGSHVPVRDRTLRAGLRTGAVRAVAVGVVSAGLGYGLSVAFGTDHAALYAVVLASSSAALVLPVVDSLGLRGRHVLALLPQVAIADAACIVALPLAIDPGHAGRAALGALAVIGAALVLWLGLDQVERRGWRRHLHRVSERRRFALELRIGLLAVFALAALATQTHVSIMLAGFAVGLVLAAIGEPHRLAKQLFAVTEGFLGPLFFVWLGASVNLGALRVHPSYVGLGLALGFGAVVTHLLMRASGQPVPLALLASAQLGVPTAAATLGTQLHLLRPGESAALLLGAVVTIGVSVLGGSLAAGDQPPGE